tara:strand:+ start:1229 stop:1696 length:468 start_codon:yes stop_codon:yes gene_type:complete
MMKKVLTIVFIFAFVSGCGFKKINDPNLKFYSIGDIKLSGNKQLGLVIQNKLKLSSSTGSKNTLFLNINLEKYKTTREKDSSNKITKYDIKLIANISIKTSSEIIERKFETIDFYDVSSDYSDTIRAQKNLESELAKNIADELISYLKFKFNNDI